MDFITLLQLLATKFLFEVLPPIVGPIVGPIIGAAVILIGGNWAVGIISRILASIARRARVKPTQVDLLVAIATAAGWVFIAAGVIAVLIAILTVSFHAVKAAIANPVKSLRTE